jgi:hypothetical protein
VKIEFTGPYKSQLQVIIALSPIHAPYSSLWKAPSLFCLLYALNRNGSHKSEDSSASVFSGFCPRWLATLSHINNDRLLEVHDKVTYSIPDMYVFRNGASFSTRGGVGPELKLMLSLRRSQIK